MAIMTNGPSHLGCNLEGVGRTRTEILSPTVYGLIVGGLMSVCLSASNLAVSRAARRDDT